VFALVAVAVTVGVGVHHLGRTQRRLERGQHRVDFEVFHRGAREAAAGRDVYRMHRRARIYPYVYPPFLVSALRPLAELPLPRAVWWWNVLQLCLIPVGFAVLWRLLASLALPEPVPVAGAGAAVLVANWPFAMNVIWAQVNPLVWVLVAGALLCWRRQRWAASGALVAVAASIKIMPVLLVGLLPTLFSSRAPREEAAEAGAADAGNGSSGPGPWRRGLGRAARWLGGFGAAALVCLWLLPGLVNGFGWAGRMDAAFVTLVWDTISGGRDALPWGDNCANHSLLFSFHHRWGRCAPLSGQLPSGVIAGLYLGIRIGVGLACAAAALLAGWRAATAGRAVPTPADPAAPTTAGRAAPTPADPAAPTTAGRAAPTTADPFAPATAFGSARAASQRAGDDPRGQRAPALDATWALLAAQLLLASILLNPITWVHHWVRLTVPLALLGVVAWMRGVPPAARAAAGALALVLGATLDQSQRLEAYKTGTSSFLHLAVFVGLTALLLALLLQRRANGARAKDARANAGPTVREPTAREPTAR
jgi:hypothetical protein